MIDPTRWVLIETWFRLGLRVEWAQFWNETDYEEKAWQDDPDGEPGIEYLYAGHNRWLVRDRTKTNRQVKSLPAMLSDDTLRHELAHWIAATDKERYEVNFGIDPEDPNADQEDRAQKAEDAMRVVLDTATYIASRAMGAIK